VATDLRQVRVGGSARCSSSHLMDVVGSVPGCAAVCMCISLCVCVHVLLDCSERTVIALAEELAACPLAKSDVGWPLELLEAAARAAATDG
jgi:hypothetical protein